MPSVKNPNGPSKNRLAARTATARKHTTKQLARKALEESLSRQSQGRITKADAHRGARVGMLPTSGPNKALSAKKARKLERKMGYALQRKMQAEGEVEMKDVADEMQKTKTKTKTKTNTKKREEDVEGDGTIEMDDISRVRATTLADRIGDVRLELARGVWSTARHAGSEKPCKQSSPGMCGMENHENNHSDQSFRYPERAVLRSPAS
ncbi:hypothetical protein FHL15_005865 [Xylaria flabelliformis]|uniref:Uncharacterized protein n=1 Tax=Xylaria flabelliformis TaxID=2512241 RepID=A0A553HZ99_9PEZI|nr:hypothetical protein FHL15_005865 [Xylaria flabelliformis]